MVSSGATLQFGQKYVSPFRVQAFYRLDEIRYLVNSTQEISYLFWRNTDQRLRRIHYFLLNRRPQSLELCSINSEALSSPFCPASMLLPTLPSSCPWTQWLRLADARPPIFSKPCGVALAMLVPVLRGSSGGVHKWLLAHCVNALLAEAKHGKV